MDVVYRRCCGIDVHKCSVAGLCVDLGGRWRDSKGKARVRNHNRRVARTFGLATVTE
jgi:hypothetical protein